MTSLGVSARTPRSAAARSAATPWRPCLEDRKNHRPNLVEGIVHYCVTNMLGAVARTSTCGLTHATMPYLRELADTGRQQAIRENLALRRGLNISDGKIYCGGAHAFGREAEPLQAVSIRRSRYKV